MRSILAGLFILISASISTGQVTGFVESIGFDNQYRPDCWTPMLVALQPTTGQTGTYQIDIEQRDLDGDIVRFTKTVTVTGAAAAGNNQQHKWIYFVPQPSGLPVATNDLNDQLRVYLRTADGGKLIMKLPITQPIINIDPSVSGFMRPRGTKLILAVSPGGAAPAWMEYQHALGLLENIDMIGIRPEMLPDSVLGYAAVNGIVWLGADPADLTTGEGDRMRALREYLRQGGQMVVCQGLDGGKLSAGFGEMLPVTDVQMKDKADLMPLARLANPLESDGKDPLADPDNAWNRLPGPFKIARATPRPGALVDEWVIWKPADRDKDGKVIHPADRSPYIVRSGYGAGSITWVAQDLGDPQFVTRLRHGWPYVWDRVFGWNNKTEMIQANSDVRRSPYAPANSTAGLGKAAYSGLNLGAKSTGLVFLAILFFIGYWIIAGPGSFFYLKGKKRAGMSWFIFGAMALAATALTILIVKVVLSGPAELKHLTVVKIAPGQPAVVESRVGLYIPKSEYQRISLKDVAPKSAAYIIPLPMHPQFMPDQASFTASQTYNVPIRDDTAAVPPSVSIPYRSTLKKLQVKWVGNCSGIAGTGLKLTTDRRRLIEGRLTNETGGNIQNVYVAFGYPAPGNANRWEPHLIYIPAMDKGQMIDLKVELTKNQPKFINTELSRFRGNKSLMATPDPQRSVIISDRIDSQSGEGGWQRFWYLQLGQGAMDITYMQDIDDHAAMPMAILGLFDLMPPEKQIPDQNNGRTDLLRRGARFMDLSQAVTAGNVVVLAEANGPLPYPLLADGQPVKGDGKTLYECVLPLDRSAVQQQEPNHVGGD